MQKKHVHGTNIFTLLFSFGIIADNDPGRGL